MSTFGSGPSFAAGGAPLPHLLADIQHRRLVAFTFADDDGAVDRDGVERAPHGADGRFVGLVAIALAHGVASADRRLFDDAEEFEREVGIHTCYRARLSDRHLQRPLTSNHDALYGGSSQRVGRSVR